MPAEGVSLTPESKLLTDAELFRLARIFVDCGVTRIRLTGGEPLVRRGVEDICTGLNELRPHGLRAISMTTNGIVLARKAAALRAAGLNSVNVSLDTLDEHKFHVIARRPGMNRVLDGLEAAVRHGLDPVKLNCVVMRGVNDDEICRFVELTKDRPIGVRFIEFMPFDGNRWDDGKFVPYQTMLRTIRDAYPDIERLRDESPNETAKVWQVRGHQGTVGFITSMSEHFCGGCNRLRLTADGHLKVCLFGSAELDLKAAIIEGRSDTELVELIQAAVRRKHERHGGKKDMHAIARSSNRPMITIGG